MLIYQGSFTVFSTYVEVILTAKHVLHVTICVLHVCGGDPTQARRVLCRQWCSPRMWR